MSHTPDATSSELPDLHDLSDAEVDALPLWHRACYILHPFNAAGLRFKSIEEWAETFFYQDPVGATEDAKRLLGFLERWALRSEIALPTCRICGVQHGKVDDIDYDCPHKEAVRVLRIIATTETTHQGKWIENCAGVFQQMAKTALGIK